MLLFKQATHINPPKLPDEYDNTQKGDHTGEVSYSLGMIDINLIHEIIRQIKPKDNILDDELLYYGEPVRSQKAHLS